MGACDDEIHRHFWTLMSTECIISLKQRKLVRSNSLPHCRLCQSKDIPRLLDCWHVNHITMEINGSLLIRRKYI